MALCVPGHRIISFPFEIVFRPRWPNSSPVAFMLKKAVEGAGFPCKVVQFRARNCIRPSIRLSNSDRICNSETKKQLEHCVGGILSASPGPRNFCGSLSFSIAARGVHESQTGQPFEAGDEIVEGEESGELVEDEDEFEVPSKVKAELKAGLYLVGTPIGNLEDITLRALRVLKSAVLILAEDTRHSSRLLRHYDIRTPTFSNSWHLKCCSRAVHSATTICGRPWTTLFSQPRQFGNNLRSFAAILPTIKMSYHKFNEIARRDMVIERLRRGEVLALISDAGMPGISDPGSDIVRACVEANVNIFPIPGPSAVISALVASGLPTDEFSFVGFLPAQSSSRQRRLLIAAKESATQVFYVPPHKLAKILDDCISAFGPSRRCAVAREMTKLHEEFWRGTLEQAQIEFKSRTPRGEITFIVQGVPEGSQDIPVDEDELKFRLQSLMDAGKSPSEATKQVVLETSARRNLVYPLALSLSQNQKY